MSRMRELKDAEQRKRAASDLSESYIIEAAAGTGKTTLLVSRILNLVKGGASLDRIIAITFTERAAADLKVKFRRELEKDLGKRDSGALAAALAGLERMQVSTIHSFCAALLKERPVEAGVDPNFEVADALTASLLRAGVWEKWLDREMDRGGDPALREAVRFGVTLDQMRTLAGKLLESRDISDYLGRPKDFIPSLRRFIKKFRSSLSAMEELKNVHCKDKEDDRGAQHIRELGDGLEELDSMADEKQKAVYIRSSLNISAASGAQKNWKPGEVLKTIKADLKELQQERLKLCVEISDFVLWKLAARLKGCVEEYEEAKRERNLLDFQDLLIYARRMLKGHPRVRDDFRRQYDYILVDEFQDTDPLQAEIAFFLAGKNGKGAESWSEINVEAGRLFLVGDPKQSIYRFRRADIEMYAEARGIMDEKSLLHISENFRCSPGIVNVVNDVCSTLIKKPEDGDYQPDYVRLNFGRDPETLPPQHGVIFLCPPDGTVEKLTNSGSRRYWESGCIAAFVHQLVGNKEFQVWDDGEKYLRPVELKDIAVLMRTYRPLDELENAFLGHGVDFRVIGGKNYYRRQEVQQLLSVLKAVENPHDTVALVAALRSPFFGISDEDIFLFRANGGRLSYLVARSESPAKKYCHQTRHSRGGLAGGATGGPPDGVTAEQSDEEELCVAPEGRSPYGSTPFEEDIFSQDLQNGVLGGAGGTPLEEAFGLLRELHGARNDIPTARLLSRLYDRTKGLDLLLLRPQGERRVANLLKISDMARALAGRGVRSYRGFVKWLSERQEDEADEEESPTMEAGEQFARILTIHKAKGLEFPVVVLCDLDYRSRETEDFIVDRQGKRAAVKTGEQKNRFQTENYDELKEHEEKRRDAEAKRLLYVAMTRARDFLVLPVGWTSTKNHVPKKGSFMSFLEPEVFRRSETYKGEWDGDVMFYDTGGLNLIPEQAPALRLMLDPDAPEPESAGKILGRRVKWQESREELRRKSASGRPLKTATEYVEPFEERRRAEGTRAESARGEGAGFGSLVHRVLEKVDWENPALLEETAREEGKNAEISGSLVKEAASMVGKTLKSPLIHRVIASKNYFKEVPFAFADDGTVIEGIIDVVFSEGGDLSLIDFKTDRVSQEELDARVEQYRGQMKVYARALNKIFGRPPKEVILFFLHMMKPVAIDIRSIEK